MRSICLSRDRRSTTRAFQPSLAWPAVPPAARAGRDTATRAPNPRLSRAPRIITIVTAWRTSRLSVSASSSLASLPSLLLLPSGQARHHRFYQRQPSTRTHPSSSTFGRSRAAAITAKIATKYTHKTRSARLSASGDSAYQPLSGASSYQGAADYRPSQPAYATTFEPGGYYDREGLGPSQANLTASRRRMYIPDTRWTWAFFLVVFVQAVLCVGLEAWVLVKFELDLEGPAVDDSTGANKAVATIPTYLAIFIFGFIYELLLTWDALRLKNTIQVIGLCLYNAGMLIYSSVELDQLHDAVETLSDGSQRQITSTTWTYLHPSLVATPCVIAAGTIALSLISWKLYGEFAWTIYKHISADLRLKQRYLQYQIYIALLKFDFFFFLAFTVQFLVVAQGKVSPAEFAVTVVAIPVSIVLLVLAAYFTRRESAVGQVGVIGLAFAAMAYFIFKLVRMYQPSQAHKYKPIRHSLTTFAVLAILLLIITIAAAIMCLRNFGKGLKPIIQKRTVTGASDDGLAKYPAYSRPTEYNSHAHPLAQVSTRMTID